MNATLPLVEARDLAKRFDNGAVAIAGLSLSIEAGRVVAVTGPSGSGKTTLFRLCNGSIRPTAGQLVVLGVSMRRVRGAELRGLRRRVAVIYQNHNLVPSLSVLQNVLIGRLGALPLRAALRRSLAPTNDERRAVYALLDELGIADKLYARAEDLSGGQQQRVAVARAFAQDPELLLADEPVASVDTETAKAILELLVRSCRERGVAVMISLHQREYVERYCDRHIELRHGVLVLDTDRAHAMEVAT
mgnify:CR=1 FL=1